MGHRARIIHLVTCLSQVSKHLFSWPPRSPAPPVLSAHLPRQFVVLSSHCTAVTASAAALRSVAVPMRVIAKNSCRVMVEPPEKGAGAAKSYALGEAEPTTFKRAHRRFAALAPSAGEVAAGRERTSGSPAAPRADLGLHGQRQWPLPA
jgi:hypothetical protein